MELSSVPRGPRSGKVTAWRSRPSTFPTALTSPAFHQPCCGQVGHFIPARSFTSLLMWRRICVVEEARSVACLGRVQAGGTVYPQNLATDESCPVASQEGHCVGDFRRCRVASQRWAFLHHGRVGVARGQKPGRRSRTRTDTIDAYARLAHLCSETTCVMDHGGLGTRIGYFRGIAVVRGDGGDVDYRPT